MLKTAEFVSPKHPDKICDCIADHILDLYMLQDPASRIAVEVMGGHRAITVSGEITSRAKVDLQAELQKIVEPGYEVKIHVVPQSPFIAQGVDEGGAGDQGIMVGYATDETNNLMPLEYDFARSLCQAIYKKYPYDGKVQVTVDGERVVAVVASFQNSKTAELSDFVRTLVKADEYLINPAGEWTMGGFDADSGLSGRKIVVDSYGPEVPVGGGSFSGKDYSKVDRSGAYMARKIAVDYLKRFKAHQVKVKLAYAIGKSEPVMAVALVDGKEQSIEGYDLSPKGIKEFLKLDKQRYSETCNWGHFGRGFAWDIPGDRPENVLS